MQPSVVIREVQQTSYVNVTDNPEFSIGTTLPCIDTPYILLPFSSILYHLGKLVIK